MVSEHASPLAVVGGVDSGGQNVHVAALASALAARGHEIVVHTRRDDPALPDRVQVAGGFTVDHVPAGPPHPIPKDRLLAWMPDFAEHLARTWSVERPDVVHAHYWMSGLAALIARRSCPVPVVQTFHALGAVKARHQGADDSSPPERMRLERAILREVDAVVATCNDELVELVRLGGDRRRVSVVPCGVDVDRFRPDGPVAPRSGRPRLLCVGRLVPRKGIATAVAALRALPTAELVVAGGPPAEQLDADPEACRLRRAAAEAGVADRLVLAGAVTREELPALYRSADVVVCAPWYEPFGIVPLEAMACGRPVVATAVGGLLDTVADGVTGLLVPPRRPDLLAAAVRGLLDDPFRADAYGEASIDRARACYRWERVADLTASAYSRLLAVPTARRASGSRVSR